MLLFKGATDVWKYASRTGRTKLFVIAASGCFITVFADMCVCSDMDIRSDSGKADTLSANATGVSLTTFVTVSLSETFLVSVLATVGCVVWCDVIVSFCGGVFSVFSFTDEGVTLFESDATGASLTRFVTVSLSATFAVSVLATVGCVVWCDVIVSFCGGVFSVFSLTDEGVTLFESDATGASLTRFVTVSLSATFLVSVLATVGCVVWCDVIVSFCGGVFSVFSFTDEGVTLFESDATGASLTRFVTVSLSATFAVSVLATVGCVVWCDVIVSFCGGVFSVFSFADEGVTLFESDATGASLTRFVTVSLSATFVVSVLATVGCVVWCDVIVSFCGGVFSVFSFTDEGVTLFESDATGASLTRFVTVSLSATFVVSVLATVGCVVWCDVIVSFCGGVFSVFSFADEGVTLFESDATGVSLTTFVTVSLSATFLVSVLATVGCVVWWDVVVSGIVSFCGGLFSVFSFTDEGVTLFESDATGASLTRFVTVSLSATFLVSVLATVGCVVWCDVIVSLCGGVFAAFSFTDEGVTLFESDATGASLARFVTVSLSATFVVSVLATVGCVVWCDVIVSLCSGVFAAFSFTDEGVTLFESDATGASLARFVTVSLSATFVVSVLATVGCVVWCDVIVSFCGGVFSVFSFTDEGVTLFESDATGASLTTFVTVSLSATFLVSVLATVGCVVWCDVIVSFCGGVFAAFSFTDEGVTLFESDATGASLARFVTVSLSATFLVSVLATVGCVVWCDVIVSFCGGLFSVFSFTDEGVTLFESDATGASLARFVTVSLSATFLVSVLATVGCVVWCDVIVSLCSGLFAAFSFTDEGVTLFESDATGASLARFVTVSLSATFVVSVLATVGCVVWCDVIVSGTVSFCGGVFAAFSFTDEGVTLFESDATGASLTRFVTVSLSATFLVSVLATVGCVVWCDVVVPGTVSFCGGLFAAFSFTDEGVTLFESAKISTKAGEGMVDASM